jgi:hypothetical protein
MYVLPLFYRAPSLGIDKDNSHAHSQLEHQNPPPSLQTHLTLVNVLPKS